MRRTIPTFLAFTLLATTFSYAEIANRESVTQLYVATFNRAPDSDGLDYWVSQSNLSLEDISTSFFEQNETQALYANLDNSQFVNGVYQNLFDRTPDEAGATYWRGELDSNSISKSKFILAVVNGATGDDSNILKQKTHTGLEFANSGSNDITLAKATIENIDINSSYCTENQAPVVENYPKIELTSDQKYSLAYMWHEEKLAKEIYLELNKIYPTEQLEKIANNAEVKHIEYVQNLVEFYDINVTNIANYEINYSADELNSMPTGKFAIPEIQELYNLLYEKGSTSQQASLEVGCMVEVTDINDLNRYVVTAGANQALLDTFKILTDGSYSHYWAFDNGLKNMGIADGCCSLGADYCHNEYPKDGGDSKGKGYQGQGEGQGYHGGKS